MDKLSSLLTMLTPFVASIAAILAWVAKIRWAKEYQLLTEKRVADVEKNASERITAAIAVADQRETFLRSEVTPSAPTTSR